MTNEEAVALLEDFIESARAEYVDTSSLTTVVNYLKNPWQPIETAPKDGSRILVTTMDVRGATLVKRGYMAVDFWHTTKRHGFSGWGKFNENYYPATDWMPLPKPPEENSNDITGI